jgi:type IV pilus assembly protein PilQ
MTKRKMVTARILLMSLLFCLVCVTQGFGADTDNRLLSVQVDKQSSTPTILVQTKDPVGYRYTVYDSTDPIRVVVDFPGMVLSDMDEVLSVGIGPVQEVRTARFDLASGMLTRLEVLLEKNTEYQVSLDGTDFRIAFPEVAMAVEPVAVETPAVIEESPAEAAVSEEIDLSNAASVLREITVDPGKAMVYGNGKIGHYQYFTLGNPPRLVVDLYDVRPGFKERSFEAAGGMKQLRVGTYNEKTRLVFDAEGSALPEHLVDRKDSSLEVSWGEGVAMMTPAVESAQMQEPVAEPQEQAVAEVAEEPAAEVAAIAPAVTPAVEEPAAEVVPVKAAVTGQQVMVETLNFINEDGRSVIDLNLSAATTIAPPVQDGDIVRFEVENATLPRSLRRTIDASAFPSAVLSVTPYTVNVGDQQNVRIAVDLKGPVAYALEDSGENVRLVIDDGAYVGVAPPQVTEVLTPAPKAMVATAPMSAAPVAPAPAAFEEPDFVEPAVTVAGKDYTGQKISLVFDNADIRSILQLIGEVSQQNLLASSDVKGNITLRLIDVPWDQALDLVMETADLGMIEEGNVLRIMPRKILREREIALMESVRQDLDDGILETRAFEISYASVKDMSKFLAEIASPRGTLIPDTRSKQIIVKDVASVLDQMADLIVRVDKPERQVMIEARIVEANTNFAFDLGVKWGIDYQDSSDPVNQNWDLNESQVGLGGNFFIPTPVNGLAFAGGTSRMLFGALDGNLNIDLRLSALEASSEGKIISTPRVTTLNGQKAVISQGTKIPYTVVSDQGTDTKFENAELKLEVTPEINPDGTVILDIKAANSAVGSIVPSGEGTAVSIDEKKAETKVLVNDGETTVLGGIFVEQENEGNTGVPILKDIPYVGHLFKSTSISSSRKELLIFITPRIVEL